MKRIYVLLLCMTSFSAWAADSPADTSKTDTPATTILKPAEIKSADEVKNSAEPKKVDEAKKAGKKNADGVAKTTETKGDDVKKTAKTKKVEQPAADAKSGDDAKKSAKKKKADDAAVTVDAKGAKPGDPVKKSAKAKKDKGTVDAKKGDDANKAGNVTPATTTVAKSPVDKVIENHIKARGGLQAWQNTNTLTFSGQMDAGGKTNPQLPFVMKVKREHKSRLELTFNGQVAIQVYDGMNGWKLRPFLNRTDVEPYTPMEKKLASNLDDLDGPLIDYGKKGTKISVEKNEPVEGHDAIKLKLTMKDGTERRVWLDAKTYLDIKTDGQPRILDGRPHKVAVYYRDYRPENGLMLPHILETVVEGVKESHKMVIHSVAVNQPMDDTLFTKPQMTALATSSSK